jgi:acetylornithine deacetylase/succinyl-diaminopimelate desuccinylase-like protein
MSSIRDLKPKELWNYFHEITQIPRPSKHEQNMINYMKEFGKKHNLETKVDKVGNVIIRKPATKGMENRMGVIFQTHLDMVPQKNSDKKHDFEKDPIETVVDGEWVRANGTTLGADNGIGVASTMAVLASKDIVHGPLEALFTIDEETGMTGVFGLEKGLLKGDILMNLDSEDEGELYVGCAGGIDGRRRGACVAAAVGAQVVEFRGRRTRAAPAHGAGTLVDAADVLLRLSHGRAGGVDRQRVGVSAAAAVSSQIVEFGGHACGIPTHGAGAHVDAAHVQLRLPNDYASIVDRVGDGAGDIAAVRSQVA